MLAAVGVEQILAHHQPLVERAVLVAAALVVTV
jgi:hypothetical protein